jgi:hypothetical protein
VTLAKHVFNIIAPIQLLTNRVEVVEKFHIVKDFFSQALHGKSTKDA